MSYSRRFSRTVSVHYSGTVSYPASQTGGSVSYSGTAHELVEVDVHVDTGAFDASVAHCNNSVSGLTASVGAMNAAQCLAIRQNADKISKSIIDGFFSTVRTDLRTQKAELEQAIDAKLLLLRQQAQTLQEKQQQMEEDYARTSARYQKIFNDLNNELRILETLYYHIMEDSRYVSEIKKALVTRLRSMYHTRDIKPLQNTQPEQEQGKDLPKDHEKQSFVALQGQTETEKRTGSTS